MSNYQTISTRVLEFGKSRQSFKAIDVINILRIKRTSASGTLAKMVKSGQLIKIDRGTYRVVEVSQAMMIERMLLYGGRV